MDYTYDKFSLRFHTKIINHAGLQEDINEF